MDKIRQFLFSSHIPAGATMFLNWLLEQSRLQRNVCVTLTCEAGEEIAQLMVSEFYIELAKVMEQACTSFRFFHHYGGFNVRNEFDSRVEGYTFWLVPGPSRYDATARRLTYDAVVAQAMFRCHSPVSAA